MVPRKIKRKTHQNVNYSFYFPLRNTGKNAYARTATCSSRCCQERNQGTACERPYTPGPGAWRAMSNQGAEPQGAVLGARDPPPSSPRVPAPEGVVLSLAALPCHAGNAVIADCATGCIAMSRWQCTPPAIHSLRRWLHRHRHHRSRHH